jgi:hypothetical protein
MTAELSKFYVRYTSSILWKESGLKCEATLSGHLNTGRTLYEQQRELRSKCSEVEGGGTFWVAVSCGENCILIALFIFSRRMFKMCALFLRNSVYAYILVFLHVHCKLCLKVSENANLKVRTLPVLERKFDEGKRIQEKTAMYQCLCSEICL